MITRSDAPDRSGRILRIAIVASIVVHLLLLVLALATADGAKRFLARFEPQPAVRKPLDEVVTISSALRFERRAKPVPAVRPAAPATRAATRPRPPRPRSAPPQALPVPKLPVAQPALQLPAQLRHELAKYERGAPRQAARTTPRQSSPPLATGQPKRLASIEHPPAEAAPPGRFSEEQLAQINADLAKAIAQSRRLVDPLPRVPRALPGAPKHYRIQMQGLSADLHRGQGFYYPIKSWRADGLDYYYVSYDFTYADGTYEHGSVPWPIHFAARDDPFASDDPALLHRTPLPPPPPGYVPPGTLGKALRSYFPGLRFEDAG